ncbi:CDP-diacylglycerol--serine O-phosphatidyltransferase [Sulfuriflexus mobilis]|uniref:CDP-diacylglycerol--serine O-phosphatidyltransferase n=1 Tax=Sulfuriflexus mobilis TaxID=1811807 RepID=UPI000F83F14C|nr:CDP-diacylglycerol--serine O-phosphatidyltransferase [Sulfuriflexus mobilis]
MSETQQNETSPKRRRRGIYLLPNLFTTAGLFAGFYAIIAAIGGHFENAAMAIFVAMLMDGFDGRVARMTHTESDFGAEYDSMADMVSFGVAPALVVHQWALTSMGNIGWFASFVYTAGAALRLARFNTQLGIADKRYFQGLASPAAAALIAGLVWLGADLGWEGADKRVIAFLLTFFAGVLMVSNIRYHSFKQFDLHGKVPFIVMVALVLAFAVIYLHPPIVLFAGFLLYAVSGLILTLWQLQRRRAERKQEQQTSRSNPEA